MVLMLRPIAVRGGAPCLLLALVLLFHAMSAWSATVRVQKSPSHLVVHHEGKAGIHSFGLMARDALRSPELNGVSLAGAVPSRTVIVFRPDGTAQFSYCDLFMRNYRQREQALVTQDLHGRASEDLLHLRVGAAPPQVLADASSLPKGNIPSPSMSAMPTFNSAVASANAA